MAVTAFQSELLRRLARSRIDGGETYASYEALEKSSDHDLALLKDTGYRVDIIRQRDYIVEARVSNDVGCTDLQWVQDSAYRFFPLIEDDLLGLTLHPFDLATNKLLALAGRRVPRDWVDTITCSEEIQPLGLLAWAANGKDLGLTPLYILEMAMRTTYSQDEFDVAIVNHADYDVSALSQQWHEMIFRARETVEILPPEEAGKAVMNADGSLFKGTDEELKAALSAGTLVFHSGTIGGVWPRIIR